MKEIRLPVACRYLRRYGGELESQRGSRHIFARGGRSIKIVAYTVGVEVYLTDIHQRRIAKVTDLPKVSGHFHADTGIFRQEIRY